MCSAREATNWPGSWQMELDIIWDGMEYGPRIRHINSAVAAIEVDVVAATRLCLISIAMERGIFKILSYFVLPNFS